MTIQAPSTSHGSTDEVDIKNNPSAARLLDVIGQIIEDVKNETPGRALQAQLNERYGSGNSFYDEICATIRTGVEEGWIAAGEITGPEYRIGQIALPRPSTQCFSVTAVYFDSKEAFSGTYHKHPYGEFSCVVPIDETFELEGQVGTWHGSGWTSFAPGTHHDPRARGGRGVSVFFLPCGRIDFDVKPSDPQPAVL